MAARAWAYLVHRQQNRWRYRDTVGKLVDAAVLRQQNIVHRDSAVYRELNSKVAELLTPEQREKAKIRVAKKKKKKKDAA